MIGPNELEISWQKNELKIVDYLSKLSWIKPLLLVASLLVGIATFDLWTKSEFPNWSRFYIAQDRAWATYILIGLSFLPLFFKQLRYSFVFFLFAVSFSWLYPISRISSTTLYSFLPILFLVASALVTNSNLFPKLVSRWLKLLIILLLFLGMVCALTFESLRSQSNKIILYFSNLHLDLLFVYFVGAIFSEKYTSLFLHFNPLQLFSPFPLPVKTEKADSDLNYTKLFIRGILQCLQAQLIFIALIVCYQSFYIKTTANPIVHYFLFVSFIVAAMKSVSAVLWMYGIDSRSAGYFLLLAKSPIEAWQRGSVFLADFLFNKIYLPIWRKFRNVWLASGIIVFAILFHTFFFHEFLVKAVLRLLFGNENFGEFSFKSVRQQALWVFAWLVWISFFYAFQKLTSQWHKSKLFQWALILITHTGSAFIIPTIGYLSRIV